MKNQIVFDLIFFLIILKTTQGQHFLILMSEFFHDQTLFKNYKTYKIFISVKNILTFLIFS